MDYDRDPKKHYVRTNGWLSAAAQRSEAVAPENLRYLTFCAVQAIDVCLLHRAQVIKPNTETSRLEGIYFCERDPSAYTAIAEQFGGLQGFLGDFSDLVLFDHDNAPEGDLFDESASFDSNTRKLLHAKNTAENLRDAFPFDVLNLDFTGPFFGPSEKGEGKILATIKRVLQWQTTPPSGSEAPSEFTIFLTNRIDPGLVNQEALNELTEMVTNNTQDDPGYAHAFSNMFGELPPVEAATKRVVEFLAISLPKLLVEEAARLNWSSEYRNIYIYRRRKPKGPSYYMYSVVCHFSRQVGLFRLARNIWDEATRILVDGHEDVDDALRNQEVRKGIEDDLKAVIEYREGLVTPAPNHDR